MPETHSHLAPRAEEPTGRQRLVDALTHLRRGRGQVIVAVLLAILGFGAVTQVNSNDHDATYAGYRQQDLIDVLNGLAGALYIGAQLGPGPRDGLMTGFARRTGLPIRVVRTCIEVTVLATGFLMGGTVGLGTVLYAVSIGPIVQELLPLVTVPLRDLPPPVEIQCVEAA